MRPDLEHVEERLRQLAKMVPNVYTPTPETEPVFAKILETVEGYRQLVDQYQENASADDEAILIRLDRLFAYVINPISDGFEFRNDVKLNRLNCDRLERQVLGVIETYKPSEASVSDAQMILRQFTDLWNIIQQNRTAFGTSISDDAMERLNNVFARLFAMIDDDIQNREN